MSKPRIFIGINSGKIQFFWIFPMIKKAVMDRCDISMSYRFRKGTGDQRISIKRPMDLSIGLILFDPRLAAYIVKLVIL